MQQLNKTKEKKTFQMTITLIHSSEVQFMKMLSKSEHFYTISTQGFVSLTMISHLKFKLKQI